VHVISNGFEPKEFDITKKVAPDARKYFRIVFTGTLYGGSDLTPLFAGLAQFLSKSEARSSVQLCFYGTNRETISGLDNYPGIHEACQFFARVPRVDCLEAMHTSSILLHATYAGSPGIMTSKVFDYLGSKRPILSVPGDGDCVDSLLKRTDAGRSLAAPEQIANYLGEKFQEWKTEGRTRCDANLDEVNKYTRRSQTRVLADILDDLVETKLR
jgi:hypothetical protein